MSLPRCVLDVKIEILAHHDPFKMHDKRLLVVRVCRDHAVESDIANVAERCRGSDQAVEILIGGAFDGLDGIQGA